MNGNGGGIPTGPNQDRHLECLTPDFCMSCGIRTQEWIDENPERKWLRVDLLPGTAVFACPKCNAATFNSNVHANQIKLMQWQREDLDRRIHLASNIIDPKTGKQVELKR